MKSSKFQKRSSSEQVVHKLQTPPLSLSFSGMAKNPVQYSVVDAFTGSAFKGNPAAVCLLEEGRETTDEWLQAMASEFNLSETCYLTRIPHTTPNPRFHLRWFTPASEVILCGHATLAAAHTLFSSGLVSSNKIEFVTLSGVLTAKRVPKINKSGASNHPNEAQEPFLIELDFPATPVVECNSMEVSSIHKLLNGAPVIDMKETTTVEDILVELPSGKAVEDFQPQLDEIKKLSGRGLIITGRAAPNSGFDFYSRFFCPNFGINEDPVCGSAHCALAPYWCTKLGKRDFVAYQASPRGGVVHLHLDEENQRVLLRGEAVTVMEGSLLV